MISIREPNKTMLAKVVSGGQTGADRAGLIAAKAVGFETGGFIPKGFLALDGYHPDFASLYGMEETVEATYPPRTWENARNSDATIRIATKWDSSGERLTLQAIKKYKRPHFDITAFDYIPVETVADWIIFHKVSTLNIAGNSEKTCLGIQKWSTEYLIELFTKIWHESRSLPRTACH